MLHHPEMQQQTWLKTMSVYHLNSLYTNMNYRKKGKDLKLLIKFSNTLNRTRNLLVRFNVLENQVNPIEGVSFFSRTSKKRGIDGFKLFFLHATTSSQS
jgi:hypothetical protein